MAIIDMSGLTPAMKARTEAQLAKLIRIDGVVMSYRDYVQSLPPIPPKEIHDGMISWSRTRFNRMDGRQQEAYEKRLRAKRVYVLGGIEVPKLVFDVVVGLEPTDRTTDAREAQARANAALAARVMG